MTKVQAELDETKIILVKWLCKLSWKVYEMSIVCLWVVVLWSAEICQTTHVEFGKHDPQRHVPQLLRSRLWLLCCSSCKVPFCSVAQHDGKSLGERRETRRPCGQVRAPGKPVQSLLQDCEYGWPVLVHHLDFMSKWCSRGNVAKVIFRFSGPSLLWCLNMCMFIHVTPQARKQNSCCEVMWCCCLVPCGHASLPFCVFLQPPSCNRRDLSVRHTWRTPSPLWERGGGQAACDWWGLKEWWGLDRGRCHIWSIFNPSKWSTSVWCLYSSWRRLTLCMWRVVEAV